MLSTFTIGSILLSAALVVVVALFLLRPFLAPAAGESAQAEQIEALLVEKEDLLRQIRELDDDYAAAKVATEMYERARPVYVQRAAEVMQQLDALGVGDDYVGADDYVVAAAVPVAAGIDAQIEAAVRRLRTPEELDDAIEAAVRQRRAAQPAVSGNGAGYCPQCGRRVDHDDRFCPACGTNLARIPATQSA